MQGNDRRGGSDRTTREFDLPKITLEITRGRANHKTREVRSAAFLIGTAPDCDLVLGDPRFDPVHSYVFASPSRVTIRQLGQGPRLCVGGRPVSWAALSNLDRLQLGPYEFQVRIEWPKGHPDAGHPGGVVRETLPLPIDDDRATERLLRDVEQFSGAPRLSLFVGDDEHQTDDRVSHQMRLDRGTCRPSQKRASF
ncbi:MAG: FHA domain-containing protein [Pirellulales bacterium]